MARKPTATNPRATAPDRALTDRLRACVDHLAGEIGPRTMQRPAAWQRTAQFVEDQLQNAVGQAAPVRREVIPVGEATACNFIVDLPAADSAKPVLIVGAHYDTVEASPGADDNASALAALFEIARHLAGATLHRPVRLIAFANEEEPHGRQGTMGSQFHARQCQQRGERVEMLALEMLGYHDRARRQRYPWPLQVARGTVLPRQGHFIAMVSNLRSAWLLHRAGRGFRLSSDFSLVTCPLPANRLIRRSDHGPFWDAGYRALMVTDTSFLRNPHYHQPTDTPDTLNYAALGAITCGLAGMIERMGQ